MLVAPTVDKDQNSIKILVYFFLVTFGIAIGMGNAYIFPSIPLIVDSNYLGTAFGMSYASKNAGTFFLSLFGGIMIGSEDEHYNILILFLFLSLLLSIVLSIIALIVDKKRKDLLRPPKLISNKKELNQAVNIEIWTEERTYFEMYANILISFINNRRKT